MIGLEEYQYWLDLAVNETEELVTYLEENFAVLLEDETLRSYLSYVLPEGAGNAVGNSCWSLMAAKTPERLVALLARNECILLQDVAVLAALAEVLPESVGMTGWSYMALEAPTSLLYLLSLHNNALFYNPTVRQALSVSLPASVDEIVEQTGWSFMAAEAPVYLATFLINLANKKADDLIAFLRQNAETLLCDASFVEVLTTVVLQYGSMADVPVCCVLASSEPEQFVSLLMQKAPALLQHEGLVSALSICLPESLGGNAGSSGWLCLAGYAPKATLDWLLMDNAKLLFDPDVSLALSTPNYSVPLTGWFYLAKNKPYYFIDVLKKYPALLEDAGVLAALAQDGWCYLSMSAPGAMLSLLQQHYAILKNNNDLFDVLAAVLPGAENENAWCYMASAEPRLFLAFIKKHAALLDECPSIIDIFSEVASRGNAYEVSVWSCLFDGALYDYLKRKKAEHDNASLLASGFFGCGSDSGMLDLYHFLDLLISCPRLLEVNSSVLQSLPLFANVFVYYMLQLPDQVVEDVLQDEELVQRIQKIVTKYPYLLSDPTVMTLLDSYQQHVSIADMKSHFLQRSRFSLRSSC